MTDELALAFNGVNGATGQYLLGRLHATDLSSIAQGEQLNDRHRRELRLWWERVSVDHLGPMEGIDPDDLADAGWGVIFPSESDPRIKHALRPLLDLRRGQAGARDPRRFRVLEGPNGVRPGESKTSFLARHGVGFGPADPERMSYYLLLVGSPVDIPYRFQYELDVTYAVGRLYFENLESYTNYAQSVVDAETQLPPRRMQATFIGVRNPTDRATHLSADYLVTPLEAALATQRTDWTFDLKIADQATKAEVSGVLGGTETPALLFTASHGVGFPAMHPRQLADQGALLCQDWPGPEGWKGPISPAFYFGADDVSDTADLRGLIAIFFACYAAGTPQFDDFAHHALRRPTAIAPHAFVGRLPQRLLSHPAGGALAVLGHVDRAWGYSFLWPGAGAQLTTFQSMVLRLLGGHRVGFATEYLGQRYAELSTALNAELEDVKWGKHADDLQLAGMWTANNDARGYVVIGDPAVHLMPQPSD